MPEMSLSDLRRLLPQTPGGDYSVQVPIPVAPGMPPLQVIPPWLRDRMDRGAVVTNDRNAVRGDDLMRQYFLRGPAQEDI